MEERPGLLLLFSWSIADYLDVRRKVVSSSSLRETRVNSSRMEFASEKKRLHVSSAAHGL